LKQKVAKIIFKFGETLTRQQCMIFHSTPILLVTKGQKHFMLFENFEFQIEKFKHDFPSINDFIYKKNVSYKVV